MLYTVQQRKTENTRKSKNHQQRKEGYLYQQKSEKGKTYYYKIKAYKKVNGKKALGQFSAVKSVKIKK